jgi:ParB family chromosome partitioning protein
VQERAEHISEWVRLTDSHAAQVAPHCKPGQKPGGINAAVRELGIDRSEAQRACKIAAMPDGRF